MGKSSDAEAEKCKKMLKEWGRRPENRLCADCSLKQPGWASTNIGVIVCIHCSGIHRKLGVHISFVKSLTLDRWNMKLAKSFMSHGGNVQINKLYEANMPRGVKPTDPTNMRALETFIRNKYQHKKYFSAKGKRKKKKKRGKEESDSESEDDSSESESSVEAKPVKKVDKGDRLRKSQRKKRRPRPAPAKKAKPTKKEAVNLPVKVSTPAEDVPDLLDFGNMKLQTTEPVKDDGFGLFSDFSPKAATSPPSFIPGMGDQPAAPPQNNAVDPFAAPVQQPQSATDKVMDLFKQTQHPQQNHNANIFTQMRPNPGFGGSSFPPQRQGFNQQQQMQGFQQKPMQGFPQQQQMGFNARPNQMGFPQQQQMGFGRPNPQMGFQQNQMGFGARPNQMGFQQQQQQQGFQQQNQMGFRSPNFNQQPMSGFAQPQNAFSSFGNVNQQNNVFFR